MFVAIFFFTVVCLTRHSNVGEGERTFVGNGCMFMEGFINHDCQKKKKMCFIEDNNLIILTVVIREN